MDAWITSQPGQISDENVQAITARAWTWLSERQRERIEAQVGNMPDGEEDLTESDWSFSDLLHDEQDVVMDSIEEVEPEDMVPAG
ncbi:uncharacterized protein J7T54_003072 [Emericellopsis cladophorae]|uniref:Uncharacterized protein n=1 Tax=Emericellopsis cladophorae TaxID=2686198 RepID=A0A9P9Y0N2_9HYPO|nr:uncharacterized protein J7T54_003072 [Emericellopsis cladophorae]KAI6780930.1 hypothetical protein J7T54_003072 [Emericellopsis cladophorae]